MPTQADAPGITSFTAEQLVRVARLFANDESLATHLDALPVCDTPQRVSLALTAHLQMWGIAWPAGSSTPWHDHGAARGAFVVVRGTLMEDTWTDRGVVTTLYGPDDHRSIEPGLVHRTSVPSSEPVLSVHAYAPNLGGARTFDVVGGTLREIAA